MLAVPCQLCQKFGANILEIRRLKKENILEDQERLVGWLGFYGLSTLVGYLMSNHVNTSMN